MKMTSTERHMVFHPTNKTPLNPNPVHENPAESQKISEKMKEPRCNSSSRLKSFPPEELKKFPNPEQDPEKSRNTYTPIARNQNHENICPISESAVVDDKEAENRMSCSEHRKYPRSESALVQQNPWVRSDESHWAYPPNFSQSATISCGPQTMGKFPLPIIASTQYPQVLPPPNEADAMTRQRVGTQDTIPRGETEKNSPMQNGIQSIRSCINAPRNLHLQDNRPLSSQPHTEVSQLSQNVNSQTVYQPPQPNFIGRRMTSDCAANHSFPPTMVPQRCVYCHYHPELGKFSVSPRMTSPKDMTVNQLKSTRNTAGQNGHSMVRQQMPINRIDNHVNSSARRMDKKVLQFTPAMIRDQELLVRTMKQQGIPEDIMRRQFDSLLTEQRRQLAHAFQAEQENIEEDAEKRSEEPIARRKMFVNEKPEWMVHITPPRLSYREIEKLREERNVSKDSQEAPVPVSPKIQQQCQFGVEGPQQEMVHWQMAQNYVPCGFWDRRNYPLMPVQNVGCFSGYPPTIYGQPFQCHQRHCRCSANALPVSQRNCVVPYNMEQRQQQTTWQNDQAVRTRALNDEQTTSRIEPSSLLKLRLYRDVIRPQKRNNGLQDPETVQQVLEKLKDAESRRGLEYLAELTKEKRTVRFNGIQDPSEIPQDVNLRPPDAFTETTGRKVSANGLENARNANNPPVRRLKPMGKMELPEIAEYPRQRETYAKAERDNDAVQHRQVFGENVFSRDQRDISAAYLFLGAQGEGDVATAKKIDVSNVRYNNSAGGDSTQTVARNADDEYQRETSQSKELPYQTCFCCTASPFCAAESMHELRTIGGITYLARKPNYIPNQQFLRPDHFTVNRHIQPAVSHELI